MKLHLIAQNGIGRMRTVATGAKTMPSAMVSAATILYAYDRWWIVESPNARQARKVVEMTGGMVGAACAALTGREVMGRVLAAGVRV